MQPVQQAMQQLSIRLLGRPEVLLDGQVTKFPTHKALALLVYLVVTGEAHAREKLMALLWPESVTAPAQASLRNTLARLRTTLGEASRILIATPDAIGIDPRAHFELDLRAVSSAVSAIQDTTRLSSPVLHQAAIGVYRGEFLAGFDLHDAPDFDHWELVQRAQWHRQLTLVLEHLAQHHLKHHDLPEAIATARRWIQHDPLDEAAYRRLMQAYSLAGDRSAALQAYQSCTAILAAELDLEPDPATTQLAKIIRQGRPDVQARARQAPPLARSGLSLPLVGRVDEFAGLVAAYAAAAAGAPRAVVVSGEAGIGKTRLVSEFLDWAALQGADVLRGQTFEAGVQLSYHPIVTALRQRLERENAPEDLLADVWLAELSRLLPELLERYPDLGLASASVGGKAALAAERLFEAVARLGAALSRRRPLVLFLDDWQWADPGSLDLLHYLSRTWAEKQAPILLVLTIRFEDLSTHTGLAQWLASLERAVSVTYAWLYRLTLADVRACVEAWAGFETKSAAAISTLSERLYRETEGVPFFLVETLKLLVEQVGATGEEGGVDPVAVLAKLNAGVTMPQTVRQAILARLDKFDQPARTLLAAAAVLGRNCHYAELCQVSGVDELAGLAALDALLAGQILIETPDAQRPYDFAHARIRDVVYTEAGHSRRRVLHGRALTALEQAAAPPAELAYHAERAELNEKARHYLQLAGDAARDAFENTLAIDYYERALALTPLEDTTGRYQLLLRRQDIHHLHANRQAQQADLLELERQAIAALRS